MKEGKTILPYELDSERVIVLLDVPALICEQCGDEFVDINVTRNIEKILDKVKSDGMKMGFVEYRKAAWSFYLYALALCLKVDGQAAPVLSLPQDLFWKELIIHDI